MEELIASDNANAEALADLKADYESKVEELEKADSDNKQALDDLKAEYTAKVEELIASDNANAEALADLKADYESKVEELEKADSDNKQAIDDLKAEYTAKVEELENAIATANTKIEDNKTELNGAITALTATYEAKMAEIDALLTSIQNTDTSQDEKIAELANKILELESATRIIDVEFLENGDLLITFGDGSTQTVKAPEKHVHTFGDWAVYLGYPCKAHFEYRICSECSIIEWQDGKILAHSFTNYFSNGDATCEEDGTKTAYCDYGCGTTDTITDENSALGHSFTNYVSDNNATCEENGTETAICDRDNCEAEDTREIENTALGHSFINYVSNNDGTKTATCENACGTTDTIIDESYYTEGLVFELNSKQDAYSVTDYTGTAKKVYIPSVYQNLPVTSIGSHTFCDCSSLTEVVIPDSVTTIGDRAFYNCYNLMEIVIPDSVTSIGYGAFNKCRRLKTETFGENSQLTSIGNNAFCDCSSLTEVVIPDSVTTIGDRAFYNCYNLTEIVIPDSVTSIGNNAFENCDCLTNITVDTNNTVYQSIDGNLYTKDGTTLIQYAICQPATSFTIPDSVTSIGAGAFSSCARLTEIVIPDSVTSIGYGAFENCDCLTGVYITDIDAWCNISFGNANANPLYYAKNLYLDGELVTKLEIPASVTSIGDYAFKNCMGFKSVTFGEKSQLTSIGQSAFSGCKKLTKIVIPDSVMSIGTSAFGNCSSLQYTIENNCKYLGNSNNPYLYLAETTSKDITTVTINQKCKFIGDWVFYNCISLTEIVIPDSVTSIGDSAFYECKSLTEVVIGDSVTSIGYGAFYCCYGLTEIVIPDSVTSIGDSAFRGCYNLTSVTFVDTYLWYQDYGGSSVWPMSVTNSATNATSLKGDSSFRMYKV